ncbi:MAG: hypothetical protein QE284_00395 [Rhizobium sp.]|nr:hypothetical protein [Rhizobium sp.]
MTQIFLHSSTGLRTLAILSGLMLGSCQTNAGDILATGAVDSAAEAAPSTEAGYRDPQVVAVVARPGASASELPFSESPPSLKRKPAPLAAAYSDIAEPPPEVLALHQQASAGAAAPQDLGVTQPTSVNTGKNSLFSATRPQTTSPDAQAVAPQAAASAAQPRSSLVPGDMPTLGVNAMSKSLFSPSATQQEILPPTDEATAPAASAPLAEPDTGPPVLHKLSDPRPKRKILALREPTDGLQGDQMPVDTTQMESVPARVQLTPAQLEAMGAVPEASATADMTAAVVDAADPAPRKKWLPSLSQLLSGGNRDKAKAP